MIAMETREQLLILLMDTNFRDKKKTSLCCRWFLCVFGNWKLNILNRETYFWRIQEWYEESQLRILRSVIVSKQAIDMVLKIYLRIHNYNTEPDLIKYWLILCQQSWRHSFRFFFLKCDFNSLSGGVVAIYGYGLPQVINHPKKKILSDIITSVSI